MRSRGFTCLILGMWLAGGLCLWFLTGENFRVVDRTLRDPHPSAAIRIQKLGPADSRLLLRYQAAEQNRSCYELWENLQVLLSLVFFFYLLFATHENKFALGVAALLVLATMLQRLLLTPNLAALGRLLDFAPAFAPSPYRGRFEVLQNTYLGMEIGKWVAQVALVAMVISRPRGGSRHSGRKFDVIDKADHGHVNR